MSSFYQQIPDDHHDFRKLGPHPGCDFEDMRLDAYLALRFRFLSRVGWQKKIRQGEVVLNGDSCKRAHRRLKENDYIQYYCPQSSEPDVDTNLKRVWEGDGVLAVCKTPNLPMHEAGVYRLNTFCRAVADLFDPKWAAVHRLDRETSGIVLCAVPEYRNDLCAALRERRMQKIYLAIGYGTPPSKKWLVDQPLGNVPVQGGIRTQHGVIAGGAESQTTFEVMATAGQYCLMKVQPHTGRTHQIRIHAAWSGLPLVGDKRYQEDPSLYAEYLDQGFTDRIRKFCLYDRLCLHATALTFEHPVRNEMVTVEAPMPEDMIDIWCDLGGNRDDVVSAIDFCVDDDDC
ncbi:MAG: RluA family pseudouridine synthase [Oligoflexales bacterium]